MKAFLLLLVLTINLFGLSEDTALSVMNEIQDLYNPEINSQGLSLKIYLDQEDKSFSAGSRTISASQTFYVRVALGMIREKLMTANTLRLVVCHELGHLLGGQPFKLNRSVSSEGQSDYYATLKCLRKVSKAVGEKAQTPITIPLNFTDQCYRNFPSQLDAEICEQSIQTSLEMSYISSHHYRSSGEFSPDSYLTEAANITLDSYPSTQCRFQTYVAGALCPIHEADPIDFKNLNTNVCNLTTYPEYSRPLCWFNPSDF